MSKQKGNLNYYVKRRKERDIKEKKIDENNRVDVGYINKTKIPVIIANKYLKKIGNTNPL